MPLVTIKKTESSGKLGIWHITEVLDDLLLMNSSFKEELTALNVLPNEGRKKEWLVARLLARELTGTKTVKIIHDKYSKPSLENSEKHISISHSHGLLVVTVDDKVTGVDIELVRPNVFAIRKKFMSDAELLAVGEKPAEELLTLYWCVKESLYKVYGKKELAFKENLVVDPFAYETSGVISAYILRNSIRQTYRLNYEKLLHGGKSYMLAYVIHGD